MPLGQSIVGSVGAAQAQIGASCLRRSAPGALFTFEVGARSDLRAVLLSAEFDGALALFGTPLSSKDPRQLGAELACVDDTPLGDTQHARLDLSLEPGSYTLAVAAPGDQGGRFELFAELEPLPPLQAVCAGALPLVEGEAARGSTRGAASSFAASCGGRGAGPDQLYAFKLARPARVRVREQSEFEAVLSLRSQCDLPSSELVCSDDSSSGHPLLNAELSAGEYYVVVDGQARAAGGDYLLMLETADVPPAAAGACARAAVLDTKGTRVELDTFFAASTTAASCGGDGAPEALFMFALPQAGVVTLRASDFEFDPVFFLRRACEYPESEVLCVPLVRVHGAESDAQERTVLSLRLPAGDYMLGVDGQTPASMGAGSIRLTFEPNHAPGPISAKPRAP